MVAKRKLKVLKKGLKGFKKWLKFRFIDESIFVYDALIRRVWAIKAQSLE